MARLNKPESNIATFAFKWKEVGKKKVAPEGFELGGDSQRVPNYLSIAPGFRSDVTLPWRHFREFCFATGDFP